MQNITFNDNRGIEFVRVICKNGYDAYLAGGCVRDGLLGIDPQDWDIASSAEPDEMIGLCARLGLKTVLTGVRHGTVTVLYHDLPIEVTSFRADGEYTDNRRPKSVRFVKSLTGDLARRDFTINAMAYNNDVGLVDIYGGLRDLNNRLVKAVGSASDRIREDALRIMRGLRFASQLGFSLDSELAESIHLNKHLLVKISRERINAELSKMLVGGGVGSVLLSFEDVMEEIIPELPRDYTDRVNVIAALPKSLPVRLTALLSEYGLSAAERILRALRFNNKIVRQVCRILDSIDEPLDNIPRLLVKTDEQTVRALIDIATAKNPQSAVSDRGVSLYQSFEEAVRKCYSLKSMAINGSDLKTIGFRSGPAVGFVLNQLLNAIIEGGISNEKDVLLEQAKKMLPEVNQAVKES